MNRSRSSLARLTLATALLTAPLSFLVPAAWAGDTDDGPIWSRLEFLPAPLGGTTGLDLRTASPDSLFVIWIDSALTNIDPDGPGRLPWLRVFSPNALLQIAPTDAAGRFRATGPVGADAGLMGLSFHAQAVSFLPNGRLEASNVATTTVSPGAAGWSYVDRSTSVPAAALGSTPGGAARDLDGDGDPDLVLVTGPGTSVHVFRNDGQFQFTDVTSTAIPAQNQAEAAGVELFDANGDGLVDIFLVGGAGEVGFPPLPNVLLLSQGNLVFAEAPLPDVAGLAQAAVVADMDGDGDLDIVLANGADGIHTAEQPDPNTLLVNQGYDQNGQEGTFLIDAAFQSAAWNSPDFNTAVAAGDIDEDGDLDLFFGRTDSQGADGVFGQPNSLLRNDGSLSFSDVSSALVPLFSDNTFGARFGDVNGDGLLDLVVANSTVSVASAVSGELYLNQGNGQFLEDSSHFPQIDESEIALHIGSHVDDVDLDGDLDVIRQVHEFLDLDNSSGLPTGGDDMLYINQGGAQGGIHGQFLIDWSYSSTGVFISSDLIVADFDLDGDNDLYICNLGTFFGAPPENDRLLENTRNP